MIDITSSTAFLIHVDVNQLLDMCLVSKQHCNALISLTMEEFWIIKFRNLPLFKPYPLTLYDWVNKYNETYRIMDEAFFQISHILSNMANNIRLTLTNEMLDDSDFMSQLKRNMQNTHIMRLVSKRFNPS